MVYDLSMRKKKEHDFSVTAFKVVQEATGQLEKPTKTFDAVALGRLGGLKGGKARAKKLTAKQLSEIARKAAQARWGKSENKT